MIKTIDVAALGEPMLEFNQTEAGEPRYLQGFGGDTSNAAIAAARAGARSAYLSRIGADAFGDRLLELWAREGVDASAVKRDSSASTGIYFVTHGRNGHEFSYLRAGSAASRMTPQWLAQGAARTLIEQSRLLHVSGISLAISGSACDTVFAAMRLAREAGTRVAFDSNLRLKLWPLDRARACTAQAVALCDVFLPSLEDVTTLTGLTDPQAIADWAHGLGARTVVLKLGGDGALVSEDGRRQRVPVHRVDLVDATGAGDCFCGNLLARLAAGDDVFDAARYANAAAALAVQGFGAVAPLPRPREVLALLAASAP
ncbi:MAG TPA: sugar kinase [Ramlibacter sp.]|nr:sugar kinase [Ramlibacter sp.]